MERFLEASGGAKKKVNRYEVYKRTAVVILLCTVGVTIFFIRLLSWETDSQNTETDTIDSDL